ncbi:MAG: hypothetical protein CME65_09610 [Halobacteriovoraceae bacterium]|nr:hypothetical protein [Halobacteriovoraceae bacterium]|tara:strand:- start:8147 stop:8743 length:597 start_codon:yes stop_codon:yes gene_type:complete
MATLELNHKKIEINEEHFFNVRSLIPQLRRKFPLNEYNFESLKMNGRVLDIDSDDPDLIRPISRDDIIALDILAKRNNEENLIDDVIELVSKILIRLETCVDLLKEDLNVDAKKQLNTIIMALETFIVSSSYICKNHEHKELLPYKELQIHLLSVMKALSDSINKDDSIMLTDLLEYELKDNLTQWKIHVLTNLKHRS